MLVLLLFIGLVGGPLAGRALRPEWSAWRAAAAANRFDSGDRAGGLATLRELARTDPAPAIRFALVRRLLEARQVAEAGKIAGALAAEAFRQADSGNPDPALLHQAVSLHAECLTAAGRPGEGLRQIKRMAGLLRRGRRAVDGLLENHLAYQRALAGEELQAGIEGMELLFDDIEDHDGFGSLRNLTVTGRLTVAAALIASRLNSRDLILPLLDREIGLRQQLHEIQVSELRHAATQWMAPTPTRDGLLDQRRIALELNDQQLALLLTVRALLREGEESADAPEAVQSDRWAVLELGHQPDRILSALPNERTCLDVIGELSPLVDTLGYLRFRAGEANRALGLLDLGCRASQLAADGIRQRWGESPGEFRDPEILERERRKSLAVLYRHRGECYAALGNQAAFQADQDRVRSLGHEWDDVLLF